MLFKNLTTNETTYNRALAWAWYRKGIGDPVEIYKFNPQTGGWDLIGGWVLLKDC